MDNIIYKIQNLGFTKNESIIYYHLLGEKKITASALAKKINMDRTLVYQNLNRLIEKGVINSIIENNVHYFFIGDIKNICFPIKKKQTLVESIIP
jgi:sugar-specific transcriptional regulator TrmB